ncbi:MAG: hypothetical protein ABIR11_12795 [Candidatus Limnocylindrales bacterium]
MDVQITGQRIFALGERIPVDEIRQKAMDRRTTAFGGGIGGLLQRPKPDDVVLLASQRRVEPFWHVSCQARYVYDRTRDYSIAASAQDVQGVTIGEQELAVGVGKSGRVFSLSVVEHCREEFVDELWVEGVSGTPMTDGPAIIGGGGAEVAEPAALAADATVVVAPEQRASSVVRQLLAKMLRPLQADVVTEEALHIERLELFYRPIWAFEFHWTTKDKRGVVEVDGLTGQSSQATSLVTQLTRAVTREALFDIGADTIGLLVPGGSIAVKVARVALDKSY